jgi:alanine racemase
VDVTGVPERLAARGGWVEVLGARTTIDDLTDRAGTIGYELLTRLGRRVHRVYQGRN